LFVHGNTSVRNLYDVDDTYKDLEQGDVVVVANSSQSGSSEMFIQVTHKKKMTLEQHLKGGPDEKWAKSQVEKRVGRMIAPRETITVIEFRNTWKGKFDPE
jgi:hypothetical protein